jgi:hypothetical protein
MVSTETTTPPKKSGLMDTSAKKKWSPQTSFNNNFTNNIPNILSTPNQKKTEPIPSL